MAMEIGCRKSVAARTGRWLSKMDVDFGGGSGEETVRGVQCPDVSLFFSRRHCRNGE